MIEAYVTNLSVSAAGGPITFANKNTKGYSVRLASDNQTFNFNVPGVYRVNVNATGETTAAGSMQLQLYSGGTAIARALSAATTTAGDSANMSFSTFITVNAAAAGNQASVTVNYTGSAGTFDLVDVTIDKVG